MLIFSTAYLCRKSFSALSLVKTKEKNCVDIQAVLRPEATKNFLRVGSQGLNQKHLFFWLNGKNCSQGFETK